MVNNTEIVNVCKGIAQLTTDIVSSFTQKVKLSYEDQKEREKLEQYLKFLGKFSVVETFAINTQDKYFTVDVGAEILGLYVKYYDKFEDILNDQAVFRNFSDIFKLGQGEHCESCCEEII